MRVLYVWIHDGHGGISENKSESTRQELAHGISGNLCRCQDYNKILNAMMRGAEKSEEGQSCLTELTSQHKAREAVRRGPQIGWKELHDAGSARESYGSGEICGGFSRTGNVVLQTTVKSPSTRESETNSCGRGASDAGSESNSHGGRSSSSGRHADRQRHGDQSEKWGERGLTMEPLYQGEPILAVAAVDELTAAEAIEKIKLNMSGCHL